MTIYHHSGHRHPDYSFPGDDENWEPDNSPPTDRLAEPDARKPGRAMTDWEEEIARRKLSITGVEVEPPPTPREKLIEERDQARELVVRLILEHAPEKAFEMMTDFNPYPPRWLRVGLLKRAPNYGERVMELVAGRWDEYVSTRPALCENTAANLVKRGHYWMD